jgi:ATP-dependent exoDNAse (exonuclease V) beta subunit
MVLLLGTTANAPLYAQALQDQGFSCVTAGGSKYFESIHVAHCQNLMNVLANPYDSQCLLDVLASEVLPVSSDDLLYLSTCLREDTQKPTRQNPAIGFLRDECAPMRSSALLDHAIHVLKRAWGRLGAERPAEVFLHAVVDSGWLARLQAGGIDGRSQAADVLKFVRLIADAQQDVGFDMARTAQKTAALFACGKEKKGALSVDEEDAVRIMTVHGSKGLEFPIVAIASCYLTGARRDTATMLTFDGAVHLSLKPPGKSPDLPDVDANFDPASAFDQATYRASIVQEDDAREYAEKRRLFYVAATRASAALIVSIRHTTTKDNRYKQVEGDILAGLCPGADDFPAADGIIDYGGDKPLTFTRIDLAKDEEATAEEPVSANDEPTQVAIPVLRPQPHIALNPVPLRADFFSYSSIAPHAAAPAPVDSVRDNGVAASIADAEAEEAGSVREVADADKATEFGSALHRTCEWLALQPNFPDEATRAAALDRFGRAFAIHDEARLRAAFDRWVSSDICARAFAHAQHQPEVPFCIEINGEVLEGEIDLLCTEAAAGEALIIDYKTGGSPAETSEVLQDKHRLQAQCYAFATLNRGWNAVELRFVRVEQAETARSDQPQVVAYRFTADDLPALEQAIAAARHAAS